MTAVDRRVCIRPASASPLTGYRNYGCRCYECSTTSAAYERGRRLAIQHGRWQPQVDAQPVIEHLRKLKRSGIGPTLAAKAAALSPALVVRYVSDSARPLPKRIRTESAEALLQVTVHAARLAGERVPSLGSRRRARALSAIGWSMAEQASRIGIPQHTYTNSINRPKVSARRAAQIAEMYDQLSALPGPSERARECARRAGWAPPMAWDDDDFDNPYRQPKGLVRRTSPTSERTAA